MKTPAIQEPPGRKLGLYPSGSPPLTLSVEVVATPDSRAQGLMFRRSLADDRGMLFVFPEEGVYPFYMKNTLISLDIIYIDGRGYVAGVLHDMQPLDEHPRAVMKPARYVLEVSAGSARRWGLTAGDSVLLPKLDDIDVR